MRDFEKLNDISLGECTSLNLASSIRNTPGIKNETKDLKVFDLDLNLEVAEESPHLEFFDDSELLQNLDEDSMNYINALVGSFR